MDINAYLEGFKAGYELAERERAKRTLDHKLDAIRYMGVDFGPVPPAVVTNVFKNPEARDEISECKDKFIQSVENAVSKYAASVRMCEGRPASKQFR